MSDANPTTYFGTGGLLTTAPGHEARPGQIELAWQTHRNMEARGMLIAEAPTGTGKSLAYLVPAVIAAGRHERTVVVTANIALQEQLVNKDLPMLAGTGAQPFDYALLKGIGNYLCKERLASLDGKDYPETAAVRAWAATTTTGDMSELEREPTANVRRLVTISTDDCTGKGCEFYDTCHAKRAKAAAAKADIVVTNYHMYFIHAKLVMDGGDGILGDHRHLVLDEGHAAPDIAREFFGARISRGGVAWCLRLLAGDRDVDLLNPELKQQVGQAADRFFRALRATYHSDDYEVRFARPQQDNSGLVAGLRAAAKSYLAERETGNHGQKVDRKLSKTAERCETMAEQIAFAMANGAPTEYVHYIEEPDSERVDVVLVTKPIDAGKMLKAAVFDTEARSKTVVSATLRAGGAFTFFRNELGMRDPKTAELTVDTPFDLQANMLLVLARGMPDPNDAGYTRAVCERLEETVRATKGRVLGLFTSHRMLTEAHRWLERAQLPYRLLRQGEAPRTKLVEQFRADTSSVLLGTASFWEGVDVPGEALSAVVIDRLPFDTLKDPIVNAINAANPKAFHEYMVPRAVVTLRQGMGRLIRTKTDRGVVVLLDPRIRTKPYGKRFLKDWPPGLNITMSLDDAAAFLTSLPNPKVATGT